MSMPRTVLLVAAARIHVTLPVLKAVVEHLYPSGNKNHLIYSANHEDARSATTKTNAQPRTTQD